MLLLDLSYLSNRVSHTCMDYILFEGVTLFHHILKGLPLEKLLPIFISSMNMHIVVLVYLPLLRKYRKIPFFRIGQKKCICVTDIKSEDKEGVR